MSKVKDYRLARGSIDEIEQQVKQLLFIGWEPLGNVFEDFIVTEIKTPWYRRNTESVDSFFVQPMVLRVG